MPGTVFFDVAWRFVLPGHGHRQLQCGPARNGRSPALAAVYRSVYLELTTKLAYGELRGVPVYQGTADQPIWMSEQVLSMGFHF